MSVLSMSNETPAPKAPKKKTSPKMRAVYIMWALIATILIDRAGDTFSRHWSFGFNETESLPFWAFSVDKDIKTPKRGDYFQFYCPPNPYYPANSLFVKHVLGVPGDVVTIKGREFFINGHSVGVAKTHSQSGQVAVMSQGGVIPEGHYFMSAPNKDSLDSRYAVIGLIDQKRLIGKAQPVM